MKDLSIDLALASAEYNKEKEYWMSNLEDFQKSSFCLNNKMISKDKNYYQEKKIIIPENVAAYLVKLSNGSDKRLHMILVTIISTLLSKYTSNKDIVVGTTIYKQNSDVEFINTILPLRMIMKENMTFKELILSVRQTITKAVENQNYPMGQIINNLGLDVNNESYPLFDVGILLDNIHCKKYLGDVKLNTIFTFKRVDNSIEAILEYNTQMYDEKTIQKITNILGLILEQIISNINVQISDIEIITQEEKRKLVYEYNKTEVEYPKDETVAKLFEAIVNENADKTAVIFNDSEITYSKLNKKANQLASLLRSKGVKENTIVGIMLKPSIEMIISIIAVLKAGGTYLPIELDYPHKRIAYLLSDSEAKFLITQKDFNKNIEFSGEIIDINQNSIFTGNDQNLNIINKSSDLCYVIYTSGTTGKPKGVMIQHQSVINYISWAINEYVCNKDCTFPFFTSISFDLTVTSIFTSLLSGNKLRIYDGPHKELLIENVIEDNCVDIIKLTPSHLKMVKNKIGQSSKLKKIIIGGEVLETNLAVEIKKCFNTSIELYNEYGPTEATVGCIVHKFCYENNKENAVSIGKPIQNTKIYILDKDLKPLPTGIVGEIYISGDVLARGYINKADLTEKNFINNPFVSGEKMYKTGDLAKWNEDGNIDCLGRSDHQLKIRGYRIELDEIACSLEKQDAVKEAVVAMSDNNKLTAYMVLKEKLTIDDIKNHLIEELPEYMIPLVFMQIDKVPLTINGKVNKKELLNMGIQINKGSRINLPQNEIEKTLLSLWRRLLEIEEISVTDNFFEIGGDSLKATLLVIKIQERFNKEISLLDVFNNPTIKELSEHINKIGFTNYEPIPIVEKRDYYPLSSAQKRMYYLNVLQKNSINYNIRGAITITGMLNKEKFENAMESIVKRHEAFRTAFIVRDDVIVQKVYEYNDIDFKIKYCTARNKEEIDEIIKNSIVPFDLSKPPLLRVVLINISLDKNIFVVDMHHIISDAVTSDIIINEFIKLYNNIELPDVKLQYKDYAQWHNEKLLSDAIKKQEEYWLNKYKNGVPLVKLMTDYPRPSFNDYQGDSIDFTIDDELTKKIRKMSGSYSVSRYMFMLSAYFTLLFKYTTQKELAVGMLVSGRNHPDLQNIVGMFVNTLIIKAQIDKNKPFNQLLNDIKNDTLEALDNQDFQFEMLVKKLDKRKEQRHSELINVMFVFQNKDYEFLEFDDFKFEPYGFKSNTSKFDIVFTCVEGTNNLKLNIEYSTRIFKKETIELMIRHYINILNEVVNNLEINVGDINMHSKEELLMIKEYTKKQNTRNIDADFDL